MRGTQVRVASTIGIAIAIAVAVGAGLIGALGASGAAIGATARAGSRAARSVFTTTPPRAVVPVVARVESRTAPIARPIVVLYGDSLAWEAHELFTAAFAGRTDVQVVIRTFGGTAICDWLDKMRADAAELAPGAVVVEFSGNALTPCMQDSFGRALTDDAYVERYRADAEAVIGIFEPIGTRVYFAGAPISRSVEQQRGAFRGRRLNAIYEEVANARAGAMYVDAGASVLDHDRWTATLPCLPGEPCDGGTDAAGRAVNVVRAPDGAHFCPAGRDAKRGVTGACPVWSSGAWRFARAMAAPVIEALEA